MFHRDRGILKMLYLPQGCDSVLIIGIKNHNGQHSDHNEHIDNSDPCFFHCAFCSSAFSFPHEPAYLQTLAAYILGFPSVFALQVMKLFAYWAATFRSIKRLYPFLCPFSQGFVFPTQQSAIQKYGITESCGTQVFFLHRIIFLFHFCRACGNEKSPITV